MGNATLKKRWKNLPAGTELSSVSDGVMKSLIKGGYIDKPAATTKAKAKAGKKDKVVSKPANKAILSPPKDKAIMPESKGEEGKT